MSALVIILLIVAEVALTYSTADTFDYVVIGGGTAGLTVAARLSENTNTTVLVLEAGEDRSEDVNVLAPGLLTSLYSNPDYDWDYHTVPQKHVRNRVLAHPRGKQLGGSSAINFLWWTHASQKDINNWGLLGNINWSWDLLQPFYKKSEHYTPPSLQTADALETEFIDSGLHGTHGPILNTFADEYVSWDEVWPRTYNNLGLGVSGDPRDGLALGGYTNLLNLDLTNRSRSYAATSYLRDARPRPNFRVLTGAHVQKILINSTSESPRAIGAVFFLNGTTHTVYAEKEVILCAGAFGSPQLLELSGIGKDSILREHGIETIVSNENVGEGLQDHVYAPLGLQVRPGIFTLDDLANETLFDQAYEEYTTNHTGLLSTVNAMSALLSLEQVGGYDYPGLNKTIEMYCPTTIGARSINQHTSHKHKHLQHSILCADIHTEAITQEFASSGGYSPQFANDSSKLFVSSTPGGHYFSIGAVLEHPFSRGSVHITSGTNASQYPAIDPKYLSHPLDIKILAAATLHQQKVVQTPPLSDLLEGNGTVYQPGYYQLDENNVEAFIRENLLLEYHPCGTCAMLPQDSGGVVDEKFRVYGVDGLRVVDASIFPLIPRANLQSLVYAIAERAAEFILGIE